MRITDEAIKTAVLEIFFDHKVSAGGRLSMQDIESEWTKTGMRVSDLHRGVQGLVRSSDVTRQRESSGLYLLLNEKGYRAGMSIPSQLVPMLRYVEGWIRAKIARTRQKSGLQGHAWRRTEDFAS